MALDNIMCLTSNDFFRIGNYVEAEEALLQVQR